MFIFGDDFVGTMSSRSLTPVLVASVSAGVVGAWLYWRYGRMAKAHVATEPEREPEKAPSEEHQEGFEVDFEVEGAWIWSKRMPRMWF